MTSDREHVFDEATFQRLQRCVEAALLTLGEAVANPSPSLSWKALQEVKAIASLCDVDETSAHHEPKLVEGGDT